MTKLTYPEYEIGRQIGQLTILAAAERDARGKLAYRCRCACGKEKLVMRAALIEGKARSCGCARGGSHQYWGARYFPKHRARIGGAS